jgi:hypothetical protein
MQTFTYSIKKLYENADNETVFSKISKLKLEKAVALTRLKGCLRDKCLSPFVQAVRKSRAAL